MNDNQYKALLTELKAMNILLSRIIASNAFGVNIQAAINELNDAMINAKDRAEIQFSTEKADTDELDYYKNEMEKALKELSYNNLKKYY